MELLAQRRIWVGIVSVLAFFLPGIGLDVPVLTDLLTAFGGALAGLVVAGLALWSYLFPKKETPQVEDPE